MILSAFLLSLAALAQNPPPASATLRGTLTDQKGNLITAPAKVQVAMRKDDGSYQQPEVLTSDGAWKLETEAGWKVIEVWARARDLAQAHAFLERILFAGENPPLELVVPPGVTLAGVVVDKLTSQPIPGARVWAESWQWDEQALTPVARCDVEGRFVLRGLTENRRTGRDGQSEPGFDLHAEAGDHAPLLPEGARFLPAADGGYQATLELVPNNCELQGVVNSAEDGSSCDGVMVAMIDALGQYRATTTSGGAFTFDRVSAGKALLWAWPLPRASGDPASPRFGRDSVEIGRGSNAAVLWLEPVAGTSISGTLEAADNARGLEVKVRLRRGIARDRITAYFDEREIEPDAQGRFACPDLLPGRYMVDLSFPADGPQPLVQDANRELDLDIGRNPAPFTMRYALPTTFAGSVPDPLPAGAFVTVEYTQEGTQNWTGVPLEANQRFTLVGFWPGRWQLRLRWGGTTGPPLAVGPESARDLVLRLK